MCGWVGNWCKAAGGDGGAASVCLPPHQHGIKQQLHLQWTGGVCQAAVSVRAGTERATRGWQAPPGGAGGRRVGRPMPAALASSACCAPRKHWWPARLQGHHAEARGDACTGGSRQRAALFCAWQWQRRRVPNARMHCGFCAHSAKMSPSQSASSSAVMIGSSERGTGLICGGGASARVGRSLQRADTPLLLPL